LRPFNGNWAIVFSVTTADREAFCVSTRAAAPTTVMVSAVAETFSVTLSAACCATVSVMSRSITVAKPVKLARASYLPGRSPEIVKKPLVSLTAARV